MKHGLKRSNIIGTNIRAKRVEQGYTQDELSAKLQLSGCDISRGTLSKIEAGLRNISVDELNAIKYILKMNYDDFFR